MLQAFVTVHDSKHLRRDCIHFVKTQCVLGDGWGGERERDFCIYTEMNRGILSGGRRGGGGGGGFCPKLDMPRLYFKRRHALSLTHLRFSNVQVIVR